MMLKSVLALMTRSLRSDERQLRTHLFRFAFVLVTYGIVAFMHSYGFIFGAPGLLIFTSLQTLNLWCILLAAVSYFATTITEEKEEMTLGLLKMAGVSPVALLLGKTAPRLTTAAVLLTAQLPFILLTITLGGVSLHQVLAAYVSLIAFLILVACLAQFFSVVSLRSRGAAFRTGLVLALYFLGPAVARESMNALVEYGKIGKESWLFTTTVRGSEWIDSTSIFGRIGTILRTGFAEGMISHQVVTNLVGGLIFFVFSWLVFDRCTRNEQQAGPARGFWQWRIGGKGILGAGRAWRLAEVWKTFNFTAGGKSMILAKFVLYGALIWLLAYINYIDSNRRIDWDELGQVMMGVMLAAIMIENMVNASRIFHSEIKWNTLSSITILPHSIASLAYSKVAGCCLALIPAITYFVLGYLLDPQSFYEAVDDMLSEPGFWYAFSLYTLLVHLIAVLSLYVKWGVLPLSLGIIVIVYMLSIALMFMGSIGGNQESMLVVPAICFIIASFMGHVLIHSRLKTLAAR
jgi:hypothetical protein